MLGLPCRAGVLLLSTAALAGCGGHGNHSGGGADGPTDAAFVNDMVPHHEGAIDMAEIARTEARHPEIRRLAGAIVAAQEKEIATLESAGSELRDPGDPAHMSGDEHARGMHMDADDLRGAKPFDREFIDMMIPHHEGAIAMAEEQLENGENRRLRRLAAQIVDSQRREIAQMRAWRAEWYGDGETAGAGHDGH